MKGITIAGRKTGLRFDVQAWLEVEEAFGSLEAMIRRMDEGERPMEAALTLAAIEINAHERHAGGTPDATVEWLRASLAPKEAATLTARAKLALTEGMRREHAEDDDGDVDLVAREIEKKTEKASGQESASDAD